MKKIILYKSKTGFTEKYANWLAQELECPRINLNNFEEKDLSPYDSIIYAGGLYAVGINGLDNILKSFKKYKNKKLIVIGIGVTPPRSEDIKSIVENNFNEKEQKEIKFFYLRGGFDYNKLSGFDKVLMTLLKWKILLKRKKTADERGMLNAYEKPLDFSEKENLKEIVEFFNKNY